MHNRRKFLIISFLAFASSTVFATQLNGRWDDQIYSIELDETFDEIEGQWGERKYDLEVDATFNEINGRVGGASIDLDFDPTFHQVSGSMSCGNINLEYDLSFFEISGVFCGQNVDLDFDTAEDTFATFRELVMDEILGDFPGPARGAVRAFIQERLRF